MRPITAHMALVRRAMVPRAVCSSVSRRAHGPTTFVAHTNKQADLSTYTFLPDIERWNANKTYLSNLNVYRHISHISWLLMAGGRQPSCMGVTTGCGRVVSKQLPHNICSVQLPACWHAVNCTCIGERAYVCVRVYINYSLANNLQIINKFATE